MSNSQNKKNEQQNNLCTTLTEQWKKGELPEGMYYIKYSGADKIDYWFGNYWEDGWNDNVEEVLAPVPSYEEYKCLETGIILSDSLIKNTEKENQQLKELLRECREVLLSYSNISGDYELYDRIDNAIGEKK